MIVRSDYEQQKILSEIMESEKQRYKFVKNKALIPSMLLSSRDRHYKSFELQRNSLDTTDGRPMRCSAKPLGEKCEQNCNCSFVVQDRAKKLRPWTDMEKCIFVDKFLQFPKDFSKIAKALVNRSTKDAVEFYYNTKYSIPYKGLLREQQQRRRQGAIGKISWEHVRQTLGLLFDMNLRPQQDDDTPASDRDVQDMIREPNHFKSHGHLRAASLAPVKLAANLRNWTVEEQTIFNEFVSVDREETRWGTLGNLLPRKTEAQLKSFYQYHYKINCP